MIAEIVARLDAQVPALKLVAGAAEFAALEGNPPKEKQPAAYVVPLANRGGDNRLVNAVRQRVDVQFSVALALGSFKDPRGETAAKSIELLAADVRAALLGWQPGADDDPVLYVRGDLIAFRDGVVWWQEIFATAFYEQKL